MRRKRLPAFIEKKRDLIRKTAAKHGAFNVRVFGSVARGEAGPESDVDLLVEVAEQHSAWFPGGLLVELEDILGRKVEIVEPEALHWYIRDQVLDEAIPL